MKFVMIFLIFVAVIYFNYPAIAEKFNLPRDSHELLLLFNSKEELKAELERKEKALASLRAEFTILREGAPNGVGRRTMPVISISIQKLEKDVEKLKEMIRDK